MIPAILAVISVIVAIGVVFLIRSIRTTDADSFVPTKQDAVTPDSSKLPDESSQTAESHQTTSDQAPPQYADRFDNQELCRRLDCSLEQLVQHQATYRTVEIPKKSGGVRRLEIPDDATKALQRTILKRLLLACQSHPMACAFEEGASIVDAAIPHQGQPVIVKMDIRRFFESTTAQRIHDWFLSIGWTEDAAKLLVQLTTYDGHLPQGAPTSPRLSNLVNAPLDQGLLHLARKHGGNYSRYADDITMSFPAKRGRVLRGVTQVVRRILRSYGYTMHGGRKLNFIRKHQQQRVLGLVVNDQVALPRKTRRWLRAIRHRMNNGQQATLSPEQLQGWEALNSMIEKQRIDVDANPQTER